METNQVFILVKLGMVVGRFSQKPLPDNRKELYQVCEDIGLGDLRGVKFSELDKKIESFLKGKRYDAAMKVV